MINPSVIGIGETSPDVLASFMQDVILQYHSYSGATERSELRESVAIPVRAQPLDEDLRPTGQAFHAVTRDVSYSGVGLIHTDRVESSWLRVELVAPHTGNEMRLLAHIEHCTPCGKYFIIGCRFGMDSSAGSPG